MILDLATPPLMCDDLVVAGPEEADVWVGGSLQFSSFGHADSPLLAKPRIAWY
jgi:hypothetical protein